MKIGQFIYSARKRKRISQEELASLLEVSRQSISLWETDQTVPTLDKLHAMCKIFDVTMDELTGIEPIKEVKNNEEKIEKKNKRKERALSILEKVTLVISLLSILCWFIDGLGIFISIVAIILNLVCWKFKLIKYVPYTLVIAIVFLFASIFKVSYL